MKLLLVLLSLIFGMAAMPIPLWFGESMPVLANICHGRFGLRIEERLFHIKLRLNFPVGKELVELNGR